MANYRLFKDNIEVNIIVADEAFCEAYCGKYGYTYELIPEPKIETEPTTEDILNAMLGVTE